jgi:hypothetical protein
MGDVLGLCVVRGPALMPVFRSLHQAEPLMWLLIPGNGGLTPTGAFGGNPGVSC